jgi:transcription-repair coupling factor (superfamily II helicase)
MAALERLEVMQDATELGAGFRIAMKDLEIRGAGELLGAKQSGNIAAVGFDMYTKLLEKAVRQRREKVDKPKEQTRKARYKYKTQHVTLTLPAVILPLQAYLAESYIQDEDIRLQIYRRMAEAITLEAVEELEQELRDRFGRLAEPADHLLYILRLRILASIAGVTQVSIQPRSGKIIIQLPGPSSVRLLSKAKILAGKVRYGRRELLLPRLAEPSEWKAELEEAMATLASTVPDLAKKMGQGADA